MSATSRVGLRAGLAILAALLITASVRVVQAENPYLVIPPAREAEATFAYRTANLSDDQAFSELARRHIPYRKETTSVAGVRSPIRLAGPLHGVYIHSSLPEAERAATPYEILDARLAIALDELCKVLALHDIIEVIHFTLYRPPGKALEDASLAQNRHPGGMAIDLGAMKKRNGEWLSVGHHWAAAIGSKTCGMDARKLEPRRGRELISIVCELADQRIFHYMLSPHFDRHHHDHLHLEIRAGARSFLVN